ncbi:uncharacterized protein LOC123534928 [Mercenaria mercenaria]|uniref:uncharacterized protein LOC123534928 n=1 Tax=Mercenaria mercenaria TaxID=6596 RepID=UPI00234E8A95|nr:uncharacterized protein LOC123534928 [Mercenaria mercenaria]
MTLRKLTTKFNDWINQGMFVKYRKKCRPGLEIENRMKTEAVFVTVTNEKLDTIEITDDNCNGFLKVFPMNRTGFPTPGNQFVYATVRQTHKIIWENYKLRWNSLIVIQEDGNARAEIKRSSIEGIIQLILIVACARKGRKLLQKISELIWLILIFLKDEKEKTAQGGREPELKEKDQTVERNRKEKDMNCMEQIIKLFSLFIGCGKGWTDIWQKGGEGGQEESGQSVDMDQKGKKVEKGNVKGGRKGDVDE